MPCPLPPPAMVDRKAGLVGGGAGMRDFGDSHHCGSVDDYGADDGAGTIIQAPPIDIEIVMVYDYSVDDGDNCVADETKPGGCGATDGAVVLCAGRL